MIDQRNFQRECGVHPISLNTILLPGTIVPPYSYMRSTPLQAPEVMDSDPVYKAIVISRMRATSTPQYNNAQYCSIESNMWRHIVLRCFHGHICINRTTVRLDSIPLHFFLPQGSDKDSATEKSLFCLTSPCRDLNIIVQPCRCSAWRGYRRRRRNTYVYIISNATNLAYRGILKENRSPRRVLTMQHLPL